MKLENIRESLLPFWRAGRHAAFWAKWAFFVSFVIPSVVFCALLAYCSYFSFDNIPRQIFEYASEVSQRPAAPAGYLTVRKCDEPKPAATGSVAKPSPVCTSWKLESRSIDSLSREAGQQLWELYLMALIMGTGAVFALGVFQSSRIRFRESLNQARALPIRRYES